MDARPFALSSKASAAHPQTTLFDLSLGEPQRFAFPSSLFRDVMSRDRINFYGSSFGDSDLRSLIQRLYYPSLNVSSHELMISHGAINGLDLILRAYIKAGDEVLIPDPCFPPYHALVRFAGGKPVSYPLLKTGKGYAYSARTIAGHLSAKTKVIIINSPHNPTGSLLDEDTRDELSALLLKNPQVLFISDEVYSKIIHDQAEHYSLCDVSNQGFTVNSLSKSHAMQGMRIGWIMAEQSLMKPIHALLQNTVGCVSSVGQELAKQILQSDYLATVDFTEARNLALNILDDYHIEHIRPESGFFTLIAVPHEQEAVQNLAMDGIRVVPGSLFGTQSKGYIRACFAQSDQEIASSFLQLAKSLTRTSGVKH